MWVIEVKKHGKWMRDIKLIEGVRPFESTEAADETIRELRRAVQLMGGCDTCLCQIEDIRVVPE